MMETVLYIHGLNCTGKIFTYLRSQLPRHEAIVAEYDSEQAIEASLQSILESNLLHEAGPMWIVGHSLGGILGYLLALRYGKRFDIKGLVSISTPFGGSATAGILRWFFMSVNVLKDITPGSKIIKEVTTKRLKTPFISIISTDGNLPFIAGQNDGIVTLESQRASLAKYKLDVQANHFEIMQDRQTAAIIKSFIFDGSQPASA